MILADIHEQKSGIPEKLGNNAVVIYMESGDYAFSAVDGLMVGIERCTMSDYLSKISSGRLADQLSRCLDYYDIVILLREGKIEPDPRRGRCILDGHIVTNFPYDAAENFRMSWQMRGVRVEDTRSASQTVYRLLALEKFFQQRDHVSHEARRHTFSFSRNKDEKLFAVEGFPLVGGERAVKLLLHYGKVGEIVMAAAEDEQGLAKVIGKSIASKIRQVCWEKWVPRGVK